MSRKLKRVSSLLVLLMLVLVAVVPATAQMSGEVVPAIIVHSVTQAERPIEYETTRLSSRTCASWGWRLNTAPSPGPS